MQKKYSFTIIGGDLRFVHLAKLLLDESFVVNTIGFDKNTEQSIQLINQNDINYAIKNSDIIILPLPFSTDEITINAPLSNNTIYLKDIYENILPHQLVLGGRLNEKAYNEAGRHGFKIIDYFEREELAVLNAIPTAEGALQIAMEELPITIHNSNCLITGFGRISKLLAKNLSSLGAKVTICARKHSDIAWTKVYSYNSTNFLNFNEVLNKFDIIFNTVPSLIFSEKELLNIKDETLIIDLASKPGGVDLICAGKLSKKVIWALSLPGKVAPFTSGEIIKETIMNMISEEVT